MFRWIVGGLLLIGQCAGCSKSDGLQVIPTTGTVTRNGQPVAELFLNFEPVSGRPSWALTDAQGKFSATYTPDRPGVLAGECRVWVTVRPQNVEEEQQLMRGEHPKAKELANLLKKYSRESTPLKLTISPGQGPLTLELD